MLEPKKDIVPTVSVLIIAAKMSPGLEGAIATLGFLAPFTFEEWTNKKAFLSYVTEVLTP
jgi:hypothetical protein